MGFIFDRLGHVQLSAFCTNFLMFQVIPFSQTCYNTLKAVYINIDRFAWTLILGIILMEFFALISFFIFEADYYNGDVGNGGENLCDNMFHCVMSSIYYGFRDGGAMVGYSTAQTYANRSRYYYRVSIDMAYWILIDVIIQNILFGLIIDAFSELKDERDQLALEEETRCFVCNLTKDEFERANQDFDKHIATEHNIWDYIFYIYSFKHLYSEVRSATEFTTTEYYVNEQLNKNLFKWLPLKKALAIQNTLESEEKKKDSKMNEFKEKLDALESR